MNRWIVLIILLAVSALAMAQTTQSNSAPSQTPQTIVLPAGPSTNTGTAVIIAPPSAPLLVTPEVHLTTVVPQVGASNATAGNLAGAANSTATLPVPPRTLTTVPQFSGTSATTTVTPAQAETAGAASAPFNAGVGVGSGMSVGISDNTGGKSLGELARENRQREAGVNARTYTNQDIDRINQQPTTQVGGMAGAAVGAGKATGEQPQPPSGNMPVVAQPTTTPSPSSPGVSQPVPSNPQPDQSQAVPPSEMGEQPAQMAQANPPAGPADQNAQASSTSSEQRGDRKLPAASSILPMMALVGVLAAGAGLLAR